VISVDRKKKELVGDFKNSGRQWCLTATAVKEHDFDQLLLRAGHCEAPSWGEQEPAFVGLADICTP
jgi:hypothetical protein